MASWALGSPIDVTTSLSPSLVFNNLSTKGTLVAYARQSDTIVVDVAADETQPRVRKLPINSTPYKIFQCVVLEIHTIPTAVVISTNGAEFWELVDGTSRLISVVGLKDVMDSGNSVMPFMRGAAVVDATQDVCVGCSNGDIAVFRMAANSNARLQRTVKCHEAPISTMTGGGDLVASGDDDGQVCLWNAQFDQEAIFPGEGLPCTCLGMHNGADALVAGFAHGVLRVIQLSTREVTVEVAAHSRCIMALDVHPTQPIFTTVSEDTYLKVWALPDSEDKSASEVALIYEERAEDRFLTGVQFTRDGSERILAAAYDSKELLVWDRI